MAGAIIGALRAELSASVAQFEKDLAQGSKAVKGFADNFDNAGKALASAGAKMSLAITAPFVIFAKGATDAARDAEELQSKFNFVFAAIGTDMNKWAEETGDSMGRSTQTMQDLASSFGLLFNKAAPTAQAAGEMSKEFSQLALDLSSFFNVTEQDALEKLRSGLVGQAEPLRAFGVFLNAADVEARALQMGLAATSKELTEQDKIMARANIIMEQTKVAQGDLARTADSASNQQRRLKEEMDELSVQVGQMLLPLLTELVKWLNSVVDWFKSLDPEMQKTIVTIAGVAAALGPLLIILGSVATGIGAIIRLVPAIIAGIKAIGAAAVTTGGQLSTMSKGLAALAAAPLVFEGGKKIGNDLGHQLGLLQASLKFGISMEEAERLYQKAIAERGQKLKDAAAAAVKAEADKAAAEQKAIADREAAAQAAFLADMQRIQDEADARQAAADRAAAAKKAAADLDAEIARQEAEIEREREQREKDWNDAFDRKWKLGDYAPDPMDDMGPDELPYDDTAAQMDLVAQTMANLPTFEVAEDFTMLTDAVNMSVDALGAMIMNGGSAGDIMKRLAQELLQMTLLGPALQGLSNSINGWLQGSGVGSWMNNIGSSIGSFFAGGFAEGGTIPRGHWGIVGERGPEPVFAGSGDLQVFPNGSGGGNTQVFNIQTKDADSFRRSERQIARDGRRRLQPQS